MSAPVDDAALRAELEAVREASRAGEIVAVSPDDARSMARHMTAATLRLALFAVALLAGVVVVMMLAF